MNEGFSLESALLYLGAAVVCVPFASRLRLGSVLGYLGAGALIGPFGLGLAADAEATLHFAEIGVVLMLFVIGLELDPKKLWAMRRAVFGTGSLEVVGVGAVLAGALVLLGLPVKAGIVAGLALSLSSTAVSMQTMSERNLTRSAAGQAAFSVLLFQDMAAIPLLGIVPLLAEADASASSGGLAQGIKVLTAVLFVVVAGRFLTRPVLRLVAGTRLREVFTAFTLLLVLGIAALMASVGVSMALGAFVAGVLLAGSEYRHALESDIEPFKGLLMGLFFMAVGMSIDFALLLDRPATVAVLLFGYQAIKVLVLRAIAERGGVPAQARWLFTALLAQGGEFAFVVFGVARSARLLPGDWDALLTLTVALSMALTPVLMLGERLLRRSKEPEKEPDAIDDDRAPVILCGFGRFGQIVGRLLFASDVKATVLDHDPDHIEVIRRFGFRVHYGDATRLDLLSAAGAERACLLINAIDDAEASLRLVEAVKEHFPDLPILARARNVRHYYELRRRGVAVVERETFEAALVIGRRALEELGVGVYEARERADRFRRENTRALEAVLPHWANETLRIEMARSAREELERQMQRERAELDRHGRHGWHAVDEVGDEAERAPA